MLLNDFLERLENVTERGGRYEAQCRAHDDQRNSLCVSLSDEGNILLKCQAGCETSSVLEAMGLKMADLFSTNENGHSNGKPRKRIVKTYDYRDESGTLLYQVVRYEPKDFRQRKPKLGEGWDWSVKGVRRILYRTPELLKANIDEWVFKLEGEKDCDEASKRNLIATTNVGGAGKWLESYSKQLAGRRVCIIPDNDGPGRKHTEKVAASLEEYAAEVKVLELPGLPDKGDLSDWFNAGGTADELVELADEAQKYDLGRRRPNLSTALESTICHGAMTNRALTDMGNAERLVARHGKDLRYCFSWGKYLAWNGQQLLIDNSGEAERRAKDTVRAIHGEAANEPDSSRREQIAKHAIASEKAERLAAMLKLARSEPGIAISPEQLDKKHWLLNCPNGTIDLKTGKLQPHNREHLITKICPTVYSPDATSFVWDQFLDRIFSGQQDLINFVQRFYGYCLTGDVSEDVLMIFFGGGANGKTTLINATTDTIGPDYSLILPGDFLMSKKGDRHPTELADLFGKRLILSVESDSGRRLNESLVKSLTGKDTIRARRMREDFWQFQPTHKLILCTNHKPRISGTDHAIWRRLRLVPFNVQFWNPDQDESGPEELRQDKGLAEKLKAEAEGILAWMVQGCLDWQSQGLGMPKAVADATKEYRSSQDVVGRFISEQCVKGKYQVKFADLFDALAKWCESGEDRTPSRKAASEYLQAQGFVKEGSNTRWYRGLTLKTLVSVMM